MTIQELFNKAGGAWKLAGEYNVHQFTVERWARNGIPPKYWMPLIKKYRITLEQIEQINQNIKRKKP